MQLNGYTQHANTCHKPAHDAVSLEQCNEFAAWALASQIAALHSTDFDNVWSAMLFIDDNMLALLDSPQGWATISLVIATDLNLADEIVMPTIQ